MSSNTEKQLVDHLVSSNYKFMVNLYQIAGREDENVFFSPISIYVALTLVYLGASGKTAEELQKYLHLPQTKEQSLEGIKRLLHEMKYPELSTVTEMFVEQSYKLQATYKDKAKKYLNSESQLVDFKNAAEKARNVINSWVSSCTNNKINDLIPAGNLDETTRLVLVNAIHFKDAWLRPFSQYGTCKEQFFTAKDRFKEVDMMHQTDVFRYKEEATFKVLELPYKNEHFKMVILLPNEIDGLAALERKLPKLDMKEILHSMQRVEVEVTLPKFKMEKFIDLNEALQQLGFKTMFNAAEADLTGIHEPTEQPLFVSKVLHKAFVEVNEQGTEAAAATEEDMSFGCYDSLPLQRSYIFRVDHPFLVSIQCGSLILFFGRANTF